MIVEENKESIGYIMQGKKGTVTIDINTVIRRLIKMKNGCFKWTGAYNKGLGDNMKRVCIVFEETGERGGKGFNVYVERLSPEALKMTLEEQTVMLSSVDFWALRMFEICMNIMKEAGVVRETILKKQD